MKKPVTELSACANCGACVNVCPHGAIGTDEDGLFYQPVIETEKCVDCGLCKAVCPIHKEKPAMAPKSAWWGRHKDAAVVRTSSSGGAFSALAEYVLEQNGVVFGAAFADDGRSVFLRSTEEVSLEALKRSKYVESRVDDAFRKIKAFLEQGRMVLVCATPCQIAGLYEFLGKSSYEKLITCDFACGGLPSHGLYEQYLTWLEQKYGGRVVSVDFRPKVYGWTQHAIKVCFDNGKKYIAPAALDPYFFGFVQKRLNIRPYCYDCGFAEYHWADLNLADFWKYRTLTEAKKNEAGLSLILAMTEKGAQVLKALNETLVLTELEPGPAAYNLKAKEKSEDILEKRARYLSACEQQGFEAGIPHLGMPGKAQARKIKIKCFVKKRMYGVK